MKGSKVNITRLDISTHLSHLPFTVDTQDAESLRRMVDKAYAQNATIEGENSQEVADREYAEMLRMSPERMLFELVEDLFDTLQDRPKRESTNLKISMSPSDIKAMLPLSIRKSIWRILHARGLR